MTKKTNLSSFVFLHACILMYSLSSVLIKIGMGKLKMDKFAFSAEGILAVINWPAVLLLGGALLIMFAYAILWQQILKKMPVSTAICNKSVTIVWGMIWGLIVFNETISITRIIGAVIIFAGIYLVVKSDE